MKIALNYLGQLREFAAKESETREFAYGASVADALKSAAGDYGPRFHNTLFDESGGLRPSIVILVNETPISKDSPPALQDGDAITLLSAIAGG